MSRTLKWILGILALLVIVAVVVGAAWFWVNRGQMMTAFRPNTTLPNGQVVPGAPNFGYGQRGNNGRVAPFGYGYGFPRGMGRMMRVGPFGLGMFFFGGLFRLLIPLLLLVLVAVIFYQLGKRSSVRRVEPAPTPAPPAEQNPPQNS